MGGVGWGSYLSSTELLIAGEAAWKLFGVGRLPVGVSGPRATTVANIVYTSGSTKIYCGGGMGVTTTCIC